MPMLTESELSKALAFYLRDYDAKRDDYHLPDAASNLCEVLGTLYFQQRTSIDWSQLSEQQIRLLRGYFDEVTTPSLLQQQSFSQNTT